MAAFQAVNSSATPVGEVGSSPEMGAPLTPRPTSSLVGGAKRSAPMDDHSPTTPTHNTFNSYADRRPLSSSSYNSGTAGTASSIAKGTPSRSALVREDSQRSGDDRDKDDGGESQMNGGSDENPEWSDGESPAAETTSRPSSKKKKGQRFFCTDFPPCNLSFTRSEHLARHIRKHTGERPFKCHCTRRFSRLDNLRQHAQTVHINEDIPIDSLAATGTRFQRQVRTDRVRPATGPRSRASTVGSNQSSHGRGHSRNLSASSIGSNASSVSLHDDLRRRPPSMMVGNDSPARARLSLDVYRQPPDNIGSHYQQKNAHQTQSPGGLSTPTSSNFSAGPGSPRFTPTGMGSPAGSSVPRSFMWDSRMSGGPGRRLSVPSGPNPFHMAPSSNPSMPYYGGSTYGTTSASSMSNHSSTLASPTSSHFSQGEFASRAIQEGDYKRRTWHPSTRSNLDVPTEPANMVTPRQPLFPQSAQDNSAQSTGMRLPGIESFDHVQERVHSPPRRGPSPMQVDSDPVRTQTSHARAEPAPAPTQHFPSHRRAMPSWDSALQQNLNRLDITSTPPAESVGPAPQPHERVVPPLRIPTYHHHYPQPMQPQVHSRPWTSQQPLPTQPEGEAGDTVPETGFSQPQTRANRNRGKRQGWYQGPMSAYQRSNRGSMSEQRASPDSSSSEGVATPSSSSVNEYNPAIVHTDWTEPPVPEEGPAQGEIPSSTPATAASSADPTPKRDSDMLRLDALVAVATSEKSAPTPTT